MKEKSTSEDDSRIDAIVALLATQLETLIQSLRELSERSSLCSIERNATSE